nr:restriction endonuclease subunit S [Rhodopirellula sp. JC639]
MGDVASFIRGITFRPDDVTQPFEKGTAVCMRTKNVQTDLDESDLISVPKSFVRRKEQFLTEGDMLVSSANSWNLVGKCSWVPKLDYEATAGGFISILRANREKVDPRYLYHWFAAPQTQHEVRLCGRQTTNISNLNYERCLKLPIPLPKLKEQERIAAILDKADAIRRTRQQQLNELQTFIEATYFKMFGHPELNAYGWDVMPFSEVCDSRLGKMLDAKQQTGTHPRFYLRNLNVQWCRLDLTELVKMDFDSGDRKEFRLEYGDVLICEGGAGVGQTAIWRDELPECYFQKSLHRVRPRSGRAVPEYIQYLMWSLMQGSSLLNSISTATIPHLTGVRLKSVKIPVPPIDVQEKFQAIVLKHEETRSRLETTNDIDEDLFSSLVQRAFKGEL